MHNATATHSVLSRLGRPIRVAPLSDWRAMADMKTAAGLSIGIYSIEHVDARGAQDAEDCIAGLRSALAVIASPAWQAATAA